jgi:hypothetical protein
MMGIKMIHGYSPTPEMMPELEYHINPYYSIALNEYS